MSGVKGPGLVTVAASRACRRATTTTGNVLPLTPKPRDAHVADLENQLRERLGTKVSLRYAQGKGALEITFFSDAELERILRILGITG